MTRNKMPSTKAKIYIQPFKIIEVSKPPMQVVSPLLHNTDFSTIEPYPVSEIIENTINTFIIDFINNEKYDILVGLLEYMSRCDHSKASAKNNIVTVLCEQASGISVELDNAIYSYILTLTEHEIKFVIKLNDYNSYLHNMLELAGLL